MMLRAFAGASVFFLSVNVIVNLLLLGSQTPPTLTLRGVAWDTATSLLYLIFGVIALCLDARAESSRRDSNG